MTEVIGVARDFSISPAGRRRSDGPDSAERFRTDFLLPALGTGKTVVVVLDGTQGYASSFLEESFGGLVREGYPADSLRSRMRIISKDDASLVREIWGYIDRCPGSKLTAPER
ncbi:MAG: hypothetical protein BroJett021_34610 [Chloroflexota bacterium]|nr:MAG: hypothetical protein BroJett021_34610 [Chloroflexota bacterium]